jgi:NRPS condensation-like uncharacterized protein
MKPRLSMMRNERAKLKQVAWSSKISLDLVKGIKNKHGATVNDVLITAYAHGLKTFLEERGERKDGLSRDL